MFTFELLRKRVAHPSVPRSLSVRAARSLKDKPGRAVEPENGGRGEG